MTTETRTIIEIGDIVGIQIECRECKATISHPVAKNYDKISLKCPNCNADLFTLTQPTGAPATSETAQHLLGLIKVMKYFEKPASDSHANLRLQLAAERKTGA